MTQSIRPSICLNMIVRNEAHIVHEVLDATAPYISSWVIVDTGSTDGTQDIIKKHQANLGIPGELHERPWIDFGHNRTEALNLAQGHADYIWVMDADDTIAGTPDFTGLDADVYLMQVQLEDEANATFWRPQLFRNGLPVRYEGTIHEHPTHPSSANVGRVHGDYRLVGRLLGQRDRGKDIDLLLAAVERNPADTRAVLHLAMTYFYEQEFDEARKWFLRRIAMSGPDEETYVAHYRIAAILANAAAPWPEVRSALMDAWEARPNRAEPAFAIAAQYRNEERFAAGYQFAKLAAQIPYPAHDTLFVASDVYAFRAVEEQVACAAALGAYPEVFALCRDLVSRPSVPETERQRITTNRDQVAPAMLEAALRYPEALVERLRRGHGDPQILVTLAGSDPKRTEDTLNSLLNCCADLPRAGRIVAVSPGLSDTDRARLQQRYGFLEVADTEPLADSARYHLRLGEGWRLFAPDNLIARLIAVLATEPTVAHVGVNYADATRLTGTSAPEETVRRAPGTGRYVLTDRAPSGPAMIDTTRIDQPGMQSATLDEVLCTTASRYIGL